MLSKLNLHRIYSVLYLPDIECYKYWCQIDKTCFYPSKLYWKYVKYKLFTSWHVIIVIFAYKHFKFFSHNFNFTKKHNFIHTESKCPDIIVSPSAPKTWVFFTVKLEFFMSYTDYSTESRIWIDLKINF